MRNYYFLGIFILTCFLFFSCSKTGENSSHLVNGQGTTTPPPTTTKADTITDPATNKVYITSGSISLNGAHDQIINGLLIQSSSGICINLNNCNNITIRNCKLGPSSNTGIQLMNCTNITIDSCYISNVSTGLYALRGTSIKFTNNIVKNVQGPFPQGQMLQFDNVKGAGNQILNNKCENVAGSSNPEDVISMYQSNGTASDPITISGNWIRGGGPSKTGSGIVLGDKGGSYLVAKDNILVNTGNCGIGIAGGSNIQVINNKVYSSKTSVSNVGIYIWNQSNSGCSLNTISGNQVNWTNAAGAPNNNWNEGNCGTVSGWVSNIWGAPIDSSILPIQF